MPEDAGLARSDARPTILPFVTPGMHDNNVAAAWTAFLLREDDSPRTFLDHVMNGLAGGAASGALADLMNGAIRRIFPQSRAHPPLAWTMRGAVMGCALSCAAFVAKSVLPLSPAVAAHGDVPAAQQVLPQKELLSDPWSERDAPRG